MHVLGSPAPKGSGRAILRGGKAQYVPSGSNVNAEKLKAWDVAVREAAVSAVGCVSAPPFVAMPLRVTIVFRLRRPSGHYNTKTGELKPSAPKWPITKPDGSKLLRSTEDSLTGIVMDDDSRFVEWFLRKCYASPGDEGAKIVVEAIT